MNLSRSPIFGARSVLFYNSCPVRFIEREKFLKFVNWFRSAELGSLLSFLMVQIACFNICYKSFGIPYLFESRKIEQTFIS